MAGEDFGHTPGADGEGPVRCSFCGKTQDQVRKLVRGHDGMFICDECVEACNEILEQSFAQDEMMRAGGIHGVNEGIRIEKDTVSHTSHAHHSAS